METCKSSMQVTSSVHRTCLDSLNGIDLPHQIIFSWPRALVSNMNRCFKNHNMFRDVEKSIHCSLVPVNLRGSLSLQKKSLLT